MENVVSDYLFPGECYQTIVKDMKYYDGPCLKLFFSRLLSVVIIAGGVIVKVPQIAKILRSHSVENLSYMSFLLELGAVTFTCTYNFAKGFPFSSWGESFFITIQVCVLLAQMFYYNRQMMYMAIFAPIYGIIVWFLTSSLVSIEVLSMLQACVIPLLLASRMYQVYTTFINKTTGQLSVITSYMNWSGTAARIFTTVQETQDPIILMMYTSSFIVNSIIMLQFGIYWNASSSKDSEKKEK